MVCVLQSKLPRSSAVFQLYCQPFFFPLKPLRISHFTPFIAQTLLFATALLHLRFVCFTNSCFLGGILFISFCGEDTNNC